MNDFKQQYVVLGSLLVAAVVGALLTRIGLDARIGALLAGFAIGIYVAIYVLRAADLKFAQTMAKFSYAPRAVPAPTTQREAFANPGTVAVASAAPQIEQPAAISEVPVVVPGNVVNFEPHPIEVAAVEVPVPEPINIPPVNPCACACGCQLESNSGFEGMCDDCRGSRLQQSLLCECDYTRIANCACGVVEHQPASVESDLVGAI